MDNLQISKDCPIMCFFIFELLTEATEESLSGPRSCFAARLLRIHDVSVSDVSISSNKVTKPPEATAKTTQNVFHHLCAKKCPIFDLF